MNRCVWGLCVSDPCHKQVLSAWLEDGKPRGSYRRVEVLDRGRGLFKILVGKAKDGKNRLVARFDGLNLVHSENGSLNDVIH